MHISKMEKNIACTYGILMSGIIIGCLLFLLVFIRIDGKWLEYGLEEYDITVLMNAAEESIISVLLKKRILQAVVFITLMMFVSYTLASVLYCGGFGLYYGFVICNLIIKFGILGFIYGIVCFFPHYILYFLIIVCLGKIRDISKDIYYKNVTIFQSIVSWGLVLFLFFVALFWEIRFQKNFLNLVFQHLV